jgi:hypothetical protein
MDEISIVQAEVGCERFALLAWGEAVPTQLLYAATFPERVSAMVVVNGCARMVQGPDYPWGLLPERQDGWIDRVRSAWGRPAFLEFSAPSMLNDRRWCDWWLRCLRLGTSPDVVADFAKLILETSVHQVLPAIQCPTLVLHRRGDRQVRVEHGRYLGEHIPDARYRELDGDDHAFFASDADALVDEIEEFITGVRPVAPTERLLATVLFSDIVESTQRAAGVGDQRWREFLDKHDIVIRDELERFRGTEVKTTGDGFLATFDGPGRAINCACAIRTALRTLGAEIRVGLHTGEVEVRANDVAGMAVHIGARVSSLAAAGEVL